MFKTTEVDLNFQFYFALGASVLNQNNPTTTLKVPIRACGIAVLSVSAMQLCPARQLQEKAMLRCLQRYYHVLGRL